MTEPINFDELGLDRAEWLAKLMARIEKKPNGCWKWIGAIQNRGRNGLGYGYMSLRVGPRLEGRQIKLSAHRLMYWATHPGDSMDLHVCHSRFCEGPDGEGSLCINPKHLRLDTQAGNMRDVAALGNQAGENNGAAKLKDSDVVRIRKMRSQGWTLKALGLEFDTHLAAIDLIVRGVTWKTVGGPIQKSRGHKRMKSA